MEIAYSHIASINDQNEKFVGCSRELAVNSLSNVNARVISMARQPQRSTSGRKLAADQ